MFWQRKTVYEFGPFRLDPRARRLLRNGQVVPLTPKVFDVLLVLIKSGGQVLSKEDLMRLVWRDTAVEEGSITRNISTLRKMLGERPGESRFIGTVPWCGYRFLASVKEISDEPTHPVIGSIAVLPFSNATGDPRIEYLADGITESLIANLSQLPRLSVMSRHSAFRYKGRESDAQSVGRDLNVGVVLMGRVVQRDQLLCISVELVDAQDDHQIWGAQYNRKIEDILTIQETIAREITERLRLKLTGPEQQRLTKRQTDDIEAYHSYLRGRYYFNKLTLDGVHKSVGYFQHAIERDPGYALAHTGLGDCCNYLAKPAEAKAAFTRALELDPTLGEAHASLGFFKFVYDWDFAGAENGFKQAVEFNPNYAEAHHWYAIYLANMARHQEADPEAKRAQELDPLSLLMNMTPALTFYLARQYDRSIEALQKIIDMEPTFPAAHSVLGNVYVQKGMYEQAMNEYQKVLELSRGAPVVETAMKTIIGHLYAKRGDISEARRILDEVGSAIAAGIGVSPYVIATVHAALGERERAFEWLHKAYEQHDLQLVSLKVDPTLDGLQPDPRFTDLVRRVGLPL